MLEESDCSVRPYETHVACEQFALVHCCNRTKVIVPAVLLLVVSDSPDTSSGEIPLFGAVCVDLLRLFFYRMWGGLCCLSVQHVKSKPVVI